MEKFGQTKSPEEEAGELYDSLPESMKLDYYGLNHEGIESFPSKEAAGGDALPFIEITFNDGRKLSLHPDSENESVVEQQIEKVKKGQSESDNIASVNGVWIPKKSLDL